MDRRVVLAGLAAAVAAVPALAQQALAQQSSGSSAPMSGQASGQSGGSGAMRAGAGQMGQAEMQHMQQTLQLGQVALETSRLAQQKAQNEALKQFAMFEIEEQTTLADILRGMMDPSATAATGAAGGSGTSTQATGPSAVGSGVTAGNASGTQAVANTGATGGMAMPMDAKGREMVQKLSQAQGPAFDRDYLMGQIEGHRDLLQVQERYLQSNSGNREHMNLVKMARGRIQEHIAELEDMQKSMK